MSAVIEIEPTKITGTGQRYRVWCGGEILVDSSRNPFTDSARALVGKGVTGRLQMKRVGRDQIDAEGLIAVLATLTVSEGQNHGPRVVKWSPHWAADSVE